MSESERKFEMSRAVTKDKINIREHSVIRCTAVMIAAAVISMSTVLGKPSPFAASFAAAMSGIDCISAFVGSVAGYILGGNYTDGVTVTSALLSVIAIRMIVSRRKSAMSDVISTITAAGSVFAANFLTSTTVSDVMNCIILSAMAGGGAYVALRLTRLAEKRELAKITVRSDSVSFVCVLAGCAIVSGILSYYSVGIFNIGIIFSACLSLGIAMKYGSGAGAVCAASTALGTAAAIGDNAFLAAVLAPAAAVAGTFSKGKKINAAGGFVFTAALCTALFTMDNAKLATVADIFMSSAIFMLIPARFTAESTDILKMTAAENSIKSLFARRLKFAGGAIAEVRRTVGITAEKLDNNIGSDISWVYNTACDEICRKCRYNMQCWGKEYGDNIKMFSKLTDTAKSGEDLTHDMFFGPLSERCPKKQELCSKIQQLYTVFAANGAEKRKIERMRSVLTAQLSATEQILSQLSDEIENSGDIEPHYNETAGKILSKLGCDDASSVNVQIGEQGRMSVEAYSDSGFFASKQDICEAMTLAFRRRFDLPSLSRVGGSCKLSLFSKTTYSLDVEICQISKTEGAACGDYYESFIDKSGIAYVVLSDGMGSGSRARVDSTFACGMLIRLLQAGIGIEAAINVINTSLMCKSSDESFATLEICAVDLYSGKIDLYKAGSANTYIKCGNRFVTIGCKGLPIGVRNEPVYDKRSFTIGNHDMIVITSDGAELNEKWLYREMDKQPDLKEFSKEVANTARFYAGDEKSDDISVIAMRLSR